MRVNLGCGEHKAPGWYNVDIRAEVDPDLVADAVRLNLPDESVEAFYLGHILEYMDQVSMKVCLLNVRRMLIPGGLVAAVGMDLDKVNEQSDPLLWEMLQKGGDETGDDQWTTRRWECTSRHLLEVMADTFPTASAVKLGDVAQGFPLVSTVSWQCAVIARRPVW